MRLTGAVAIVTGDEFRPARTVASAMRREGAVVVEAPQGTPVSIIQAVVEDHGRLDALVVTTTAHAAAWCEAAGPAIASSGGGSITTLVTMRALAGDVRRLDEAAAGGAVVALTRAVATAFGRGGVRANTVAVPAPEVDAGILARSTLLPRLGHPDDVASLVVFLSSGDAAFVTGQVLRCDGGLLAHLPHYAALMESGTTTTGR